MTRPSSALLVITLLALGCVSTAALPGWTLLGQRTVNHRVDRDEIAVGVREGRFDRIRIAVRGRAVTFRDVRVHYRDGRVQDVALRQTVPAGGESRAIDLAGSDRTVTRVSFVYDTAAPRGPRAVVVLYGWH